MSDIFEGSVGISIGPISVSFDWSLPRIPPDVRRLEAQSGGSLNDLPSLGTITSVAGVVGLLRWIGIVNDPFAADKQADRAFAHARRFRSIFSRERLALRDEQGRSGQEQLDALRMVEWGLRNQLVGILQNILPESIARRVGELHPVFMAIDRYLYNTPEGKEWRMPVQRLPQSDRIRPRVRTIEVVVQGSEEMGAVARQRWSRQLRDALEAQTYSVEGSGAN